MSWTTYPHNYTFSVLYMSNSCEYVAKNSISLCVTFNYPQFQKLPMCISG